MQGFLASSFIIGILIMVFYTPVKYARGIYKMTYEDLSTSENVICAIPIVNVVSAEKLYTGRFSKILLATIVCGLFTAFRLWAIFGAVENAAVQLTSIILFIIGFILVYIANVYSVFIVLNDVQAGSLFDRLVKAIIFPFGQYYIGTYLNIVIDNMQREEKTFK